MSQEGQVGRILELIDGASERETVDAVLKRLSDDGALRRVLSAERIDFPVVDRFVRLLGVATAPALLESAERATDAKARERLYDLVAQAGPQAVSATARRLAEASQGGGRATAQRELLTLLGKLMTPEMPLPLEVDLKRFLRSDDAHVRREAVRLLLRGTKRDEAMLAGLNDADGRIVYLALTAALERCSREGLSVIRGRVERGELDAPLRALGIRVVASLRTPDTLRWLIDRVSALSALFRRRRLLPVSPEMIAALTAIVGSWRSDPEAAEVIALASRSKVPEIRNAVRGQAAVPPRAA
jgi:CBS domain-containing protein